MKKLLILLTAFLLLMTLNVSIASDAEISISDASIPEFTVTLNGQKIESGRRQFPLLVYKDITYFPMTYHDCRFLGLETAWDDETKTLSIEKKNITCAYRDYDIDFDTLRNDYLSVCNFNIIVNGKEITNSKEEYPLLTFRDVTYFPLTWRFAHDEFGWEYSFDNEVGLKINSSNPKTETVNLPNISGSAIFDGEYYYYNGKSGDANVIYAAFHERIDDAYVIHQLPDTNLSRSASFIKSSDGIYIKYWAGTSPVMSTQKFYKLDAENRTAEEKKPDSYIYSAHGYSEIGVRNGDITVFCENPYFDSATKITYTKNGESYEMPDLPGRVRVGCRSVNGKFYDRTPENECIKIFGDKIYFMAYDYETEGYESGIYAIDTNKNTVEKIIDKAEGAFHVYSGWVAAMQPNSTMIVYGNNGSLYRYLEVTGVSKLIYDGSERPDMVMLSSRGGYDIYACMKSLDGARTIVLSSFGAYGDGLSAAKEIFSTNTGTYVSSGDLIMAVYTAGESPDDEVRLFVPGYNEMAGENVDFRCSDAASWVSVCDNYMLYGTDGKVVKVNLE